MSDLLALAERCEKASGPDRDLDGEIAACLRVGNDLPDWAKRWAGEWRPTIQGSVVLMQDDDRPGPHFSSLAYTGSLDAAMTLFQSQDCNGTLHMFRFEGVSSIVSLFSHEDAEPGDGNYSATAKTLPLALCAATLRARASQEASKDMLREAGR